MERDYLGEIDAKRSKAARDDLFNYIVDLERKLDHAEALGKEGDIEMLSVLSELNDVENDLRYYSERANEPVPMRNYHTEVSKLIHEYLGGILQRQAGDLEQIFEDSDSKETKNAASRLDQLDVIVSFYRDLYPELDLALWAEKIVTIRSKYAR